MTGLFLYEQYLKILYRDILLFVLYAFDKRFESALIVLSGTKIAYGVSRTSLMPPFSFWDTKL